MGRGVVQNYKTAARWCSKAAAAGHDNAEYLLGAMFYKGLGVKQSYEEAVMWYSKAVKKQHPAALYDLGICYYYGNGVAKNMDKAIELWKLSAELEFEDAVKALKNLRK